MSFADARARFGDDAPIALVDLGDTLCDCTTALRAQLARLRHADEDASADTVHPLPAYVEARRRLVMGAPGFWRALAPRAAGFQLLQMLREEGFAVQVVTKGPRDAPQAWADKVAWCRDHLPGVPVIVADDKSLVYGHVLVDDWLPYVSDWQRRWATGLAILPAQPWNADAPAHPRRVRYDGHNLTEVQAALRTRPAAGVTPAPLEVGRRRRGVKSAERE